MPKGASLDVHCSILADRIQKRAQRRLRAARGRTATGRTNPEAHVVRTPSRCLVLFAKIWAIRPLLPVRRRGLALPPANPVLLILVQDFSPVDRNRARTYAANRSAGCPAARRLIVRSLCVSNASVPLCGQWPSGRLVCHNIR